MTCSARTRPHLLSSFALSVSVDTRRVELTRLRTSKTKVPADNSVDCWGSTSCSSQGMGSSQLEYLVDDPT